MSVSVSDRGNLKLVPVFWTYNNLATNIPLHVSFSAWVNKSIRFIPECRLARLVFAFRIFDMDLPKIAFSLANRRDCQFLQTLANIVFYQYCSFGTSAR